jgi:thiamine biosynthesis lipoprotein ApbE
MLFSTASASVLGANLAICDALATALVVADEEGPELARSLGEYESYLIRSDGTEHASAGIVFATESVP